MPRSDTWLGGVELDKMKEMDSAGSCDSVVSINSGFVGDPIVLHTTTDMPELHNMPDLLRHRGKISTETKDRLTTTALHNIA